MSNKKEINKSEEQKEIIAEKRDYDILLNSPLIKRARHIMEFAIKHGGNTPYRKQLFLQSVYSELQLESLDKLNNQLKGFSMALGRIEKAVKKLK